MLKNSSTLAVCVPINLSIKLGFVSINGPRKPDLVDAPRITCRCDFFFSLTPSIIDVHLHNQQFEQRRLLYRTLITLLLHFLVIYSPHI